MLNLIGCRGLSKGREGKDALIPLSLILLWWKLGIYWVVDIFCSYYHLIECMFKCDNGKEEKWVIVFYVRMQRKIQLHIIIHMGHSV